MRYLLDRPGRDENVDPVSFALVLDQCTLKPNSYQTYPRLNCFIGSVVVLFRTAKMETDKKRNK
jgi:hypothetical protein